MDNMKVHHIGYLAGNLKKSVEAFQKLGYQVLSEIIHDTIRLVDICFMGLDGYTIELVSPYDRNSVVSGIAKKYRNMPYHICYEADDFLEGIKSLELNGFTRMDEPCPAPAIGGRNVCFLMSARIGIVEILEGGKNIK